MIAASARADFISVQILTDKKLLLVPCRFIDAAQVKGWKAEGNSKIHSSRKDNARSVRCARILISTR